MPTKVKSEVTCDRCGHVELLDGYPDRNPNQTLFVIKTYQKWLFPKMPSSHEGEYVTQHLTLCPACTAAFVNLMQPGRLAELTAGLATLVEELRRPTRGPTRGGAPAPLNKDGIIDRLNKLISG